MSERSLSMVTKNIPMIHLPLGHDDGGDDVHDAATCYFWDR